jgi:hypothetical protein
MAISTNFLLKGVRGTINKQIVIRQYGSKTVLSGYPNISNYKPSAKQKRRHEIMRLANKEVRRIKADKALREAAQLRLNLPSNMLHHALLKECMIRLDLEVK